MDVLKRHYSHATQLFEKNEREMREVSCFCVVKDNILNENSIERVLLQQSTEKYYNLRRSAVKTPQNMLK